MDLGLTAKTGLVLGAGGGLGGAIAVTLAREGVNVAIADVDQQALERTLCTMRACGAQGMPIQWDLSDWRSTSHHRRRTTADDVDREFPVDGDVGHRDHRSHPPRDARQEMGPGDHEHVIRGHHADSKPRHLERPAILAGRLVEDDRARSGA